MNPNKSIRKRFISTHFSEKKERYCAKKKERDTFYRENESVVSSIAIKVTCSRKLKQISVKSM